MFPGCELLYRTVVFWFSSACIPCSPVWPLWPPSVRDVPWIRCRTEMGGWKRMAAETRQVVQSAQRASINPLHAVRGESAAGCGRHGCVNMPRWNKDHQTHTHTHTPAPYCNLVPQCFMWPAVVCWGMPNRTTNGPDTQPDDIKVNWLVPVLSLSVLLFVLLFSLCLVSFPVSILALFKSLSTCISKSTFYCNYSLLFCFFLFASP